MPFADSSKKHERFSRANDGGCGIFVSRTNASEERPTTMLDTVYIVPIDDANFCIDNVRVFASYADAYDYARVCVTCDLKLDPESVTPEIIDHYIMERVVD